MNRALAMYGETLSPGGGDRAGRVVARKLDGSTRRVPIERWLAAADEVDEHCLGLLQGPVLDVGCGPGRHLHALARLGVFGLGVDISAAAVTVARGSGATAVVASIFDELPGTGHWRSALLFDGNVGIGGHPTRLLRRVARLLIPGGALLVEVAAPSIPTVRTLLRLETRGSRSEWFPWAEVSAADIERVAASAGLAVESCWQVQRRWFALLRRV
ncbi:MAG TPA: methyltransferase domain-containing protein [Solirubrobacteraceae bacterium]|jgi:SAM-dependent methyltransferase